MFKNQIIRRLPLLLMIPFCLFAQKTPPKRTILIHLKATPAITSEFNTLKIDLTPNLDDSLSWAIITPGEATLLAERGIAFKKIMESQNEIDLHKRVLFGESMKLDTIYHTYDEILQELKNLSKKYPQLLLMKKIGITTQEKRDIWAVKISDQVAKEEDAEPAILFSGAIHSNELVGTEICMRLIHHLLTNYGKDERVTRWIDNNEIWFIPVINVDGHYVVTRNIDPNWRKNTRDNNRNGILYEPVDGIDLNRNFDFNWAHGGSGDSTSERYRGEYPFSENECVAFRNLALEQHFVLAVTYHSQGEVIFYPWAWGEWKAPDDKLLTKMAKNLAAQIRTMKEDTTYIAHYGAGTVGQTYPWLYGRLGTFDFIIETGANVQIFPPAHLEQIIQSNLPGAFYMLDQLAGPGLTGKITDTKTGKPLEAQIFLPDIDYEDISPRVSSPQTGRYFRLLEPGSYRIIIRKPGYQTKVIRKAEILEKGWTNLDVKLSPEN